MAEGIMRHLLPEDWKEKVIARSAGIFAFEGFPPSELAYMVCMAEGIDISYHISRRLSEDIVRESDIILTMERSHMERAFEIGGENKAYLLTGFPDRSDKAREIDDPLGMDRKAYEIVFKKLEREIKRVIRHVTSS
jgi:protein-tyrosine-phosphatase